MKITNGKGKISLGYEIEVVSAENYTSIELWIVPPGESKPVFLTNHTVFGEDSDFTCKAALIGAEEKWGLELLKFDLKTTA